MAEMKTTFTLAALFLPVAFPAWADVHCSQPYAPEIHAGAGTTMEEIRAMRADTQAFIAASDIYQSCLQKTADKNLSFVGQAKMSIEKNQHEKERVGKAFNDALAEFSKAPKNLKTSDASN